MNFLSLSSSALPTAAASTGEGITGIGSTGSGMQGYPLFQLRKLLSLKTSIPTSPSPVQKSYPFSYLAPSSPASPSTSTSPPSSSSGKEGVVIRVVAAGSHGAHSFIAIACSNNHLIFRYVDETGVPVVRQMPWPEGEMKAIVAMDFNPTAQLLCCVTGDSTLILIPLYFLMRRKVDPSTANKELPKPQPPKTKKLSFLGSTKKEQPSPATSSWSSLMSFPSLLSYAQGSTAPSSKGKAEKSGSTSNFGTLDDVTVITACTRTKLVSVTSCVWWNSCEGDDYGIIGTLTGRISIVDFYQQKEVHTAHLRHAITKLEIVVLDSYKVFPCYFNIYFGQ
jgi:hypothetical protein